MGIHTTDRPVTNRPKVRATPPTLNLPSPPSRMSTHAGGVVRKVPHRKVSCTTVRFKSYTRGFGRWGSYPKSLMEGPYPDYPECCPVARTRPQRRTRGQRCVIAEGTQRGCEPFRKNSCPSRANQRSLWLTLKIGFLAYSQHRSTVSFYQKKSLHWRTPF